MADAMRLVRTWPQLLDEQTEDDRRDALIASGRKYGHIAPSFYTPPSYVPDTWLCHQCRGPRKADLRTPRPLGATHILLECGHRVAAMNACAAVIE